MGQIWGLMGRAGRASRHVAGGGLLRVRVRPVPCTGFGLPAEPLAKLSGVRAQFSIPR